VQAAVLPKRRDKSGQVAAQTFDACPMFWQAINLPLPAPANESFSCGSSVRSSGWQIHVPAPRLVHNQSNRRIDGDRE